MKFGILFVVAIDPSTYGIATPNFPHLGIGHLVSYIRKKFGNAFRFKVIATNEDIKKEINNFRPKLIGISSTTPVYNGAINCAKIAKKCQIPVIIGGMHISMAPFTLTVDMDVGVIGEGEETICDLLNSFIDHGMAFDKKDLQRIDGIAFKDKDRLIITKTRKFIKPLDKIPMPARDLFKIGEDGTIVSTRGCPYQCVFCSGSHFWRGQVRIFSAERVVSEIRYLLNTYNVTTIHILDDIFIIDRGRIEKIVKFLEEEGLLRKVNYFTCQVRANLVDEKIIDLLKKMKVRSITMGLESGSQRILKFLKGDTVTLKDAERSIRIIKKAGIESKGNFMIGSPGETKEDVLETLKFIRKTRLDAFEVYFTVPFPGTPLWEYAKSQKIIDERTCDWSSFCMKFDNENYHKTAILSDKLTNEELYKLYLLFKKEPSYLENVNKRRRL